MMMMMMMMASSMCMVLHREYTIGQFSVPGQARVRLAYTEIIVKIDTNPLKDTSK